MSANIQRLEGQYPTDIGGKVRLLTLDHLDGRTLAVRRIREVEAQIAADLGNDLTEAQKQMVRRGAVIHSILDDYETRWAAGEELSLTDYLAAVNVQRRVLATIGLERRAKEANDRGLKPLLGSR